MVAQEDVRPLGKLLRIQKVERLLGLVLGLEVPGPRQRTGQLSDRVDARQLEMLIGRLKPPGLEIGQPEEGARRAMVGPELGELLRQLLHARPA